MNGEISGIARAINKCVIWCPMLFRSHTKYFQDVEDPEELQARHSGHRFVTKKEEDEEEKHRMGNR